MKCFHLGLGHVLKNGTLIQMSNRAIFLLLISLLGSSWVANANESITLNFAITDVEGSPVSNGVVLLTPTHGEFPQSEPDSLPTAIMNQIDKQFVPHVLVVQKNTEISFPNADNLFHHVYSFSPTKQFELKLYKEFTAEPLLFEQSGIVDIGCNIHDWMLGYIVISDSPYFLKTDDQGLGQVTLPKGEYSMQFWHPAFSYVSAFENDVQTFSTSTTISVSLDETVPNHLGFDDGFGDY